MIDLHQRISAFSKLGSKLRVMDSRKIRKLIKDSVRYNGWFSEDMTTHMIAAIGASLDGDKLNRWLEPYKNELQNIKKQQVIGVVMAGNIPAVGFHDFLSVLISGNKLKAKLSGDDNKLLPAIAELLVEIEPAFENDIEFTEERLQDFDAIIATGSSNTSRYFEYYFGKYPNIIRKNRNGIAILNGSESVEDLDALADDIFLYYGLGCRNVSKLYVPVNYNFMPLLDALAKRKCIVENHKYYNNYEYNKAIYLVNGTDHFDTENALFVEDENIASPVSVVYYSKYNDVNDLTDLLEANKESIQCVVSNLKEFGNVVPFGKSQQPELWDYADGVDTMHFLLSLD